MPRPGSKQYDTARAHKRKEAEDRGIPDKHADEAANRELQKDPEWQAEGPVTERGLGPKSERKNR